MDGQKISNDSTKFVKKRGKNEQNMHTNKKSKSCKSLYPFVSFVPLEFEASAFIFNQFVEMFLLFQPVEKTVCNLQVRIFSPLKQDFTGS